MFRSTCRRLQLVSLNRPAALLSLPFVLVLAGCPSTNTSGGPSGPEGAGAQETINPAAPIKAIEPSAAKLIDGTSKSLTFQANGVLPDLAPGDIIASTSPLAPFLRRVVERTTDAQGNVTLITNDVALDEAFGVVNASVYGEFVSFVPAGNVTVNSEELGFRTLPGKRGQRLKEISIANLDISIKANDNKVEGSLGVKLTMNAILELQGSLATGLQHLKIVSNADSEIEVGLSFKNFEFLDYTAPLGKMITVFTFGVVPVYGEIGLYLELSGNITTAVAVSTKDHVEIGGIWGREAGWEPVLVHRPGLTEGKAQGQCSLQALVTEKWILYGVLGPKVGFGPYFNTTVSTAQPCDIVFEMGLKGEASLEFGDIIRDALTNDKKAFAFERKLELSKGTQRWCDAGPKAPSGLQAGLSESGSVALSWVDNSEDEVNFLIQWNNGGGWVGLAYVPANTTEYVHLEPTPAADNLYQVLAVGNGSTLSAASNIASVSVSGLPVPSTPLALEAVSAGHDAAVLVWEDTSNNEVRFLIERAEDGGDFTPLAAVDANTDVYRDITVQAGKSYEYRVRAQNAAGASDYSNIAGVVVQVIDAEPTTPATPTAVAAGIDQSGNATVVWLDRSGKEEGFTIERSSAGGAWTSVGTVAANSTAFTDPISDPHQTYLYRVRAFNAMGSSDYSNVVSTADGAADGDELSNEELCDTLGLCCPVDGVCDSSWYACSVEDSDCALCGVNDGRCVESCLTADPDCPSRELICGAIGQCCANDGRCDVRCPLADIDPDCTNAQMCADAGACCPDDQLCHAFCNERDPDCPDSGGSGTNDNVNANTNDNNSGAEADCTQLQQENDVILAELNGGSLSATETNELQCDYYELLLLRIEGRCPPFDPASDTTVQDLIDGVQQDWSSHGCP